MCCVNLCHQNVLVLSLKIGEKTFPTPNHMTSGKSKKGEKKEWSEREGRAVEDEGEWGMKHRLVPHSQNGDPPH